MAATTDSIPSSITMSELLDAYPGARRALFSGYHIGGCRSCGFQPDETLEQVCRRNENLPVDEVIDHILSHHEKDAAMLIAPSMASEWIAGDNAPLTLDVRTREEHEAVRIPGSLLLTQESLQQVFANSQPDRNILLYDHTGGGQALDLAAYFVGHGFTAVKVLDGGIDAWSTTVDSSLPRYKLELGD